MASQLLEATDTIEVTSLFMLLYGPPGGWKTSVAQTANDPLTLDFDRGAHRSFNRKAVMRFDKFSDLADAQAEIMKRQTVVVDTIGRLLDFLTTDIITQNPKHGSAVGGLTLQGYGALKARFASWVGQIRNVGKDIVFLCHEKEEKDGDDRIMRPDIQGGSYIEVMKFTDLVGYLGVDRQGRRFLDFNPSDRHLGKNAAGWQSIAVPDLATSKSFLADLLADAKSRIGKTAEASADIAKTVSDWQARLAKDPVLAEFNGMLPEYKALGRTIKPQIKAMLEAHAKQVGWKFDVKNETFYAPVQNTQESAA